MATLVRWEPFPELASLQSEVGRLFGGLAEGPLRTPRAWVPRSTSGRPRATWSTRFDLPGIPEEKISIEVADDTLTVSAEREKETEESGDGFYRFERRYGTFSRAVGLPQGADEAKISAASEDGVLEVGVPKPEEQRPRKIQLGSGPADIEANSAA